MQVTPALLQSVQKHHFRGTFAEFVSTHFYLLLIGHFESLHLLIHEVESYKYRSYLLYKGSNSKAITINNTDRYHFYHRKILLRYPANFTSIFKNGLLIPKPVDHIH